MLKQRWGRHLSRLLPMVLAPLALVLSGITAVPAYAAAAITASESGSSIAGQVDLSSWMGQMQSVIGDRPLDRIAMPGSHDATSWDITPTSGVCPSGDETTVSQDFPTIASSMSVSQSGSFVDQLNEGSRYLDLRLCDVNGVWYGYHGGPLASAPFFDTGGVAGQADQIGAWIRAHPSEIVIISVTTSSSSSDPDADELQALTDMAQAIGGTAMTGVATEPQLTPDSTYDQFMAAGKNAVLLDMSGNTPQPWAWPAAASQQRGSYNYNSPTWQQWLEATITGDGLQQIEQTTLNLCTNALEASPADYPDSFFTLETLTDPTLTIPDAVFAQAEAALGLIPASEASHYLLYEEDQLNAQLLGHFEGEWAEAPLAQNLNLALLDDVNENQPGMPEGTLERAVIADNVPVIPAQSFYLNSQNATGGFSSPQPVAGVGGAPMFSGTVESIAALPDGDTQMIGEGLDGRLYHNILSADGSWQGWAAMAGYNGGASFSGPDAAITGMPDGSSQVAAVGLDGHVYHNIRYANATSSWQGWEPLPGLNGASRFAATRVALAGMPDGSTQLAVIGSGGVLYLDTRNANGSWSGWSPVPGPDGAASLTGTGLAIAAASDGSARLAAVDTDGNLWYTIHNADGSWQSWTELSQSGKAPAAATSVSVTVLPDGAAQVAAVGNDGNAYLESVTSAGVAGGFTPLSGIGGTATFPASMISVAGLSDGTTQILTATPRQ